MGWESRFALIKDHDYRKFACEVVDFRPDLIGFNIYTGNHLQAFAAIDRIKRLYPNIGIIVGGPHPTYFPMTAAKHADYVVMSEGFHSLSRILSGDMTPGILPFTTSMRFPMPDREQLYKDYPEYGASRIKSIIAMTGCPYRCTYCYNSSSVNDIKVSPELAQEIGENLGMSGRLFPFNIRCVDDVVAEGKELKEKWDTQLVYFQDDVHGFDTKEWLPAFANAWKYLDLPYHAQMRWEMVNGHGGENRLQLIADAFCTGLTMAVEAADPVIRKEVLDRATKQELMFDGIKNIKQHGFKIRTEQIIGLPYGATKEVTKVNLAADLDVLALNIELKPTMAWASTFAPYAGTKLGKYADKHGHYSEPDNYDVPDTFFERSVLRFPSGWIGPHLSPDSSCWLEGDELERYRDQNAALRRHFNLLALQPNGTEIARKFLYETDLTTKSLCGILGGDYFDYLPKGDLARDRYQRYMQCGDKKDVLSTAVRHHLYDNILYETF